MTGMQRTSVIVIGIAVVVLAIVIGFLLFGSDEEPAASPSPESVAPSASSSLNAEMLDRRWTVLYVGTDLNATREADGAAPNTDALMVASLSADQSELTLISLPRDTVDVPLADGGTWPEKINSLYVQRGIDELVGAMETLYGVPIDAYVVLDMDDFASTGGRRGHHRGVAAGAAGGPDREPGSAGRAPGARCGSRRSATSAPEWTRTTGAWAASRRSRSSLVRKLVDPETDVNVGEVTGLPRFARDRSAARRPADAARARTTRGRRRGGRT